MHPDDEKILKVAKEIVVKFIELGKVSPSSFEQHFKSVFWTLKNTVVSAQLSDLSGEIAGRERSED